MVAEVFDQVLLRPPLVVAMPSGVQNQNIFPLCAGRHSLARLLRREQSRLIQNSASCAGCRASRPGTLGQGSTGK
jgi:hypothetical protein